MAVLVGFFVKLAKSSTEKFPPSDWPEHTFSGLKVDVGGPSPLWTVPSLGRWVVLAWIRNELGKGC